MTLLKEILGMLNMLFTRACHWTLFKSQTTPAHSLYI